MMEIEFDKVHVRVKPYSHSEVQRSFPPHQEGIMKVVRGGHTFTTPIVRINT